MTKILEDQIPQNAPRCSASGIQWKIILRILLLNRMYVKLIRHYYLLCASWDWGLAKYYSIIFSLNLLKRQFSWLGAVNAQRIRLLLDHPVIPCLNPKHTIYAFYNATIFTQIRHDLNDTLTSRQKRLERLKIHSNILDIVRVRVPVWSKRFSKLDRTKHYH